MNSSCSRLAWMTWLLVPCTLHAQSTPIDPPLVGRPADFSNIVGKYKISATAAPTEVAVEQAILLHITITGEGPAKYEPKREFLRLFPDTWGKGLLRRGVAR